MGLIDFIKEAGERLFGQAKGTSGSTLTVVIAGVIGRYREQRRR